LPEIDHPLHERTSIVTRCGRIVFGPKKVNFHRCCGERDTLRQFVASTISQTVSILRALHVRRFGAPPGGRQQR